MDYKNLSPPQYPKCPVCGSPVQVWITKVIGKVTSGYTPSRTVVCEVCQKEGPHAKYSIDAYKEFCDAAKAGTLKGRGTTEPPCETEMVSKRGVSATQEKTRAADGKPGEMRERAKGFGLGN